MTQALVTGANRGIGLEFTRQLLARGDRVIATCRAAGRALDLTRLAGEYPGHLKVLPLDVTDARSIAELVREIEELDLRIDLLINNAGVLPSGERFGSVEARTLADTFNANVSGPFVLTQALSARLVDGGKVIAIGSGIGSIAGTTGFSTPSYAISKAALNMAVRLLGHALAERRIAVLGLSPGWVKTDMGGVNANLDVADSVQSMLNIIERTRFDDASIGAFIAHDGKALAW